MSLLRTISASLLIASAAMAHAQSSSPQWVWSAGKQTNDGSVTVKSLRSPGATMTGKRNPTGTAVDQQSNATVQPPVVMTASPPSTGDPYAKWSFEFQKQIASYP